MTNFWQVSSESDGSVLINLISLTPSRTKIEPRALAACKALTRLRGQRVIITGPGAVEAYCALGYHLTKIGVAKLSVRKPVNIPGDDITLFDTSRERQGKQIPWFEFRRRPNGDEVSIIPCPRANHWPDTELRLTDVTLPAGNQRLCITGKGGVMMYAALGVAAALAGRDDVMIDKPQEANLIAIGNNNCGATWSKQRNRQAGVVIGIVGDPNSGKSVLAHALSQGLTERYAKTLKFWLYNGDLASPTTDWFLDNMQKDNHGLADRARHVRAKGKKRWTPELEKRAETELKALRFALDLTLADMPGGLHHDDAGALLPQPCRIPTPGRAAMLATCDFLIIVSRADKPEVFAGWQKALASYGLEKRILAEIISTEPDQDFSWQPMEPQRQCRFRYAATGLNRLKLTTTMSRTVAAGTADLLRYVRYLPLARAARAALAKAFAPPGEPPQGAAVLTCRGNMFSAGQFGGADSDSAVPAVTNALCAAVRHNEPDLQAVAFCPPGMPDANYSQTVRTLLADHADKIGRDFDVVFCQKDGTYELSSARALRPTLPENQTMPANDMATDYRQGALLPGHTDLPLECGAHVLVEEPGQRSFLAMIWDPCILPGKTLLKLKYEKKTQGWLKLPHAFTEDLRYLTFMTAGGLNNEPEGVAAAAIIRTLPEASPVIPLHPLPPAALTALPLQLLQETGIRPEQIRLTGSRSHGLSRKQSDYDMVVLATPQQIQHFRHLVTTALQQGRLYLPERSGTWKLLEKIFPGGTKAVTEQGRFLETLEYEGESYVSIFVPPHPDAPALSPRCDYLGRTAVSGIVRDARNAPYKRSACLLETEERGPIHLVCYHKMGNLLREGDQITGAGFLYQHQDGPDDDITLTLVQLSFTLDPIIWLQV